MKTVTIDLYTIDELSAEAKQKAIDECRYHDTEGMPWYEFTLEEHVQIIQKAGFDTDSKSIYFRGFSSQGDGAMFEYTNIKDTLRDVFIDSLNLSPMRKTWLKTWVCVEGLGKHSGSMYHHENTCSHSIEWYACRCGVSYTNFNAFVDSFYADFENFVESKYKTLCKELYKELEAQYDHLTSDEIVIESCKANEYYFNSDGSRSTL